MASDIRNTIKQLRTQQHAQLGKLNGKNESEVELLEVVNAYFRKRAEIEAQYAGALEKLSKHYTTRKFKKMPSFGNNQTPLAPDDSTSGVTYAAFSSVLVESEKQALQRGLVGQKLVQEISDVVKDYIKTQGSGAKRNLEFGTKYHQELWTAYEDLEKTKQSYDKTAKEAEIAHRKYEEIARKPGSGLLSIKNLVTGTDTEERVEKHRSKWKSLSRKLNDARNEYILALENTNVIQQAYYKEEIPQLMLNLDGNFYTTYPALLDKYTALESDYTSSLHASVEAIRVSLRGVDRAKENEGFLGENRAVFQDPFAFQFESSAGDDVTTVTVDDVTKVALGHRLGRLMKQQEDLGGSIAQRERELAGLTQMADVYSQTPSFGNAATPLEQRQDLESSLRLLHVLSAKTAAQVQTLSGLGVQPIMPIHPAQAAVGASAAGPTASKANAVAVYDYDSKGDGEISLRDGDDLVILIPETDGWIKVRNLVSQGAGLVPASYIKVVEEKSLPPSASMLSMPAGDNLKRGSSISVAPSSRQGSVTTLPTRSTPTPATSASRQVKAIYDFNATDEGELNFKAGDMIDVLDTGGDFSDEAWWEGRVARTGESGQFPTVFTQGWQALQQQQSSVMNSQNASMASLARAATSSHRMSIIDTGAASRRTSAIPARPVSSVPAQPRARAMYVYEATCDGELSMEIGDIVVITNKNTGSDAWWEGEGPQGKGQFPVNYVEEIHDAAPSAPQPPAPSKRLSIVRPAAAHPQAKALYDYIASADDEIGFKAGDIISLTDATDSDWYVGELHGQSGAFPANYVQKL